MDEPRWPPALAALVAAILYATLPAALVIGPTSVRYVIPALVLVLVVLLTVPGLHDRLEETGRRRQLSILQIGLIALGNAIGLAYLIHQLLYGGGVEGRALLYAAFDVWVTNVIVFALGYWELDGGGPLERASTGKHDLDFAFVQQTDPEVAATGWRPTFPDYLYLAFTNASAFSPTDTMPLTRRAKMLMMAQSTISLITVLLVAARAVSILKG